MQRSKLTILLVASLIFASGGAAGHADRMRCKDYVQARKFFECLPLSGDPEQRSDERRMPSCVTSG